MPRFSVIIPTYNRSSFIKTAIDSVLRQTYSDFELIITDDGSTDSTDKLLGEYTDSRMIILTQENKGVSAARNSALEKAGGDFIAFLDSDDRWLSKKLEVLSSAINNNPGYNVFHTQEKWFRNGRHLNHMKKHMKKGGEIFKDCLKMCCVSISTAVLSRAVIETIGGFNEDLEVCEDYEFWLRVTLQNQVYLIDRVLTEKEGGHPDQLSLKYASMDRFRIKAICELLNSHELSENNYSACFSELKRKCDIYVSGCLKRGKYKEADECKSIIENYGKKRMYA